MASPLLIAVGTLGGLCFLGLMVEAHSTTRRPTLRAVLALAAALALIGVTVGDWRVVPFFAVSIGLALGAWHFGRTRWWWAWVVLIVALLIVSKLPGGGDAANPLQASRGLWLGFSYLVFRLIHVTVDKHLGRIKDATLTEFLTYALHPASITSGPIDRMRSSKKAQRAVRPFTGSLRLGLWRIGRGLVGKYLIANTLFTLISTVDMTQNPDQPVWAAWLWLVGYSFYLLADFAAYSDIAIGFGHLAGLDLPENFDRPYLSPSPAVFWQRWHMSLSFWVRDYIFFPIARGLRKRYRDDKYMAGIQFMAHMTTMGAVGLWHGLTPGFLVWGLYHGLGLFLHGQFAPKPKPRKNWQRIDHIKHGASVGATYLFVTVGWAFFAADLPTALRILTRLVGL